MHTHRSSMICNKQNTVEDNQACDRNKIIALHAMMFYNLLKRKNTPAKTQRVQNMRNSYRTCRVPKSHWSLHAKFILEGSQGRGGVVGPVTPSASSQPILQLPKDSAKAAPMTLTKQRLEAKRLLVIFSSSPFTAAEA